MNNCLVTLSACLGVWGLDKVALYYLHAAPLVSNTSFTRAKRAFFTTSSSFLNYLSSCFVFSFKLRSISGGRLQSVRCLSGFLRKARLAPGLPHQCGCPLNGCPFSTLMGPLSARANTTAIIAGKASGDLARFCPGQLERKSFDNDNAVGREKEGDVEGDISHFLCS